MLPIDYEDESDGVVYLRAGPIVIDDNSHSVYVDARPVNLTRIEYSLLRCIVLNAGSVVPYDHLLRTTWGAEYLDAAGRRNLRITMGRLRQRIGDCDPDVRVIKTCLGIGYWAGSDADRLDTPTPEETLEPYDWRKDIDDALTKARLALSKAQRYVLTNARLTYLVGSTIARDLATLDLMRFGYVEDGK